MSSSGAVVISREEYEAAFEAQVAGPLGRVVGRVLWSVTYYMLDFEVAEPGFDPANVNEHGAVGALLRFDGGVGVELNWDFRAVFRDEAVAYYLTASTEPLRAADALPAFVPMDPEDTGRLRAVNATAVEPWVRHRGTVPVAVAVWACRSDDGRSSPQAAEFRFPGGSVVVALGDAGDAEYIGECDQVLVFDGDGWSRRRHETCTGRPLFVAWRSGGGADQI